LEGTGSCIFIEELDIRHSINLDKMCSVFQAEVLAIRQACKILQDKRIVGRQISIYMDSQAALKAVSSQEIKSSLVMTCKAALDTIGNNLKRKHGSIVLDSRT
jgi:ribonuclease HI